MTDAKPVTLATHNRPEAIALLDAVFWRFLRDSGFVDAEAVRGMLVHPAAGQAVTRVAEPGHRAYVFADVKGGTWGAVALAPQVGSGGTRITLMRTVADERYGEKLTQFWDVFVQALAAIEAAEAQFAKMA